MTTHKRLTFDEYVAKYFTPVEHTKFKYDGKTYHNTYTRKSDGYIYSVNDVSDSLDYYNMTGREPK